MTATITDEHTQAAEQIEAGAVLPVGVLAQPGQDTDVISARSYAHPGLPDRTVVRLVPATLAPADDLTMSYLGFTEPDRTTDVGLGRRRALGFPAWALINDPGNAHHALNLVKDLERIARQAKSSPGAARDALIKLAEQLDGSAPHFLPTFFEQAGRIYLEAGSLSYAATMFGKAREVEEVHNLRVDPDRLRAVFLEFAFAGALSAKALSGYSRTLTGRYAPDEAYELFRTLCVERTKGGLPPYRGMPEDLRRLARAAKLSPADEDRSLLRAILDTPAVSRAAAGFWKSYRASLIALATDEPAIRGLLLSFVPESTDAHELWLAVLAESGATAGLTEPVAGLDPAVLPPAGPVGWLNLMLRERTGGYSGVPRSEALLGLVAAMVPRLRADGGRVRVLDGWRTRDLDVLDLLLAEQVPIVGPGDRLSLDVDHWQGDTEPGRRDLAAIAADDRLGRALATGLLAHLRQNRDGVVPAEVFETVRATPGLLTALRQWTARTAEEVGSAGFGSIEEHLRSLNTVRLPLAYVDVVDTARRIAGTDLPGALAAALRGGVFDELGWPALEQAVAQLSGAKPLPAGAAQPVQRVGEGWPALVLANGAEQLVVVGPDGILLEHTLRVPKDRRGRYGFRFRAHYVDGRLLIIWAGPEHLLGYWSDAPDSIFEVDTSHHVSLYGDPDPSIPLPGGGRFTGGVALHPGDTRAPASQHVLSDGTTYWTHQWRDGRSTFFEVDLATGDVGRASLPSFLEDFAEDGTELQTHVAQLRPVAPGTEHSPLGVRDGLHGWRLRKNNSTGKWTAERIDGERVTAAAGRPPLFAVRLPGDERSRVVRGIGNGYDWADPDGRALGTINSGVHRPVLARGTVLVPPADWWHCLKVRDQAGSLALRQVTREQAEALLAAAVAERQSEPAAPAGLLGRLRDKLAGAKGRDLPGTLAAVLPQLTHPELIAGVLGVIRYAAGLQVDLAGYAELAEQAAVLDPVPVSTAYRPTEADLTIALDWTGRASQRWNQRTAGAERTMLPAVLEHYQELARRADTGTLVRSGESPEPVQSLWVHLPNALAALAYRAASPFTPDTERPALLYALEAFTASGMISDGRWRTATVAPPAPAGPAGRNNQPTAHSVVPTPNGFVLRLDHLYDASRPRWRALQYSARPGEFALPDGWTLDAATEWHGRIDRAWVDGFQAELAANGPLPHDPEWTAELVRRTGMSRPEAALLLAGMPQVNTWETNFLTAEQRTTLGLKAAEAASGRGRLRGLDHAFALRLLDAMLPADPAAYWTSGPDLDAVTELWLTRFRKRPPIPDELLVDAEKSVPVRGPGDLISGIVDPESCGWLTRDAGIRLVDGTLTCTDNDGFVESSLTGAAAVLAWLPYRLPADSPIRAKLGEALELACARAYSPAFLVDLGRTYHPEPDNALLRLLGVPVPELHQAVEVEDWLVLCGTQTKASNVYLRPANLRREHRDRLTAVLALLNYPALDVVRALDLLADDELRAACAVPVADGAQDGVERYFQDPALSVPDLVAEVAGTRGLSADAAVLYLQLLALPDPSDPNVARWTGWKPARLKKARAELAETELVLTAKRARARRSLFLPGGWLALKDDLPIEEWKKPMFRFTTAEAHGVPLRPLVPPRPVAAQFRLAWQRVLDGDAPGYTELVTGRRR